MHHQGLDRALVQPMTAILHHPQPLDEVAPHTHDPHYRSTHPGVGRRLTMELRNPGRGLTTIPVQPVMAGGSTLAEISLFPAPLQNPTRRFGSRYTTSVRFAGRWPRC